MEQYRALKDRVLLLLDWYHKIMSINTTETRKKEFKEKAIAKIEEGRRHLGLDMIVRTTSGEQANEKNTPLIQLYNMHKDYNKDMTITSIIIPHEKSSNNIQVVEKTYHLLLDLKIFMCSVGEQTEIYVSIYNKATGQYISEEFLVVLTGQGMPYDVSRIGKLKSLFVDLPLSSKEMHNNLCIVYRLIRKGKLVYESKKDKKNQLEFRRPFGCAVLPIDDPLIAKTSNKETEITVSPIFTSSQEINFANLQDSINKKTGNFQEIQRAKGIVVGLTLYQGELKQVLQQHSTIMKEVPLTQRLRLPEIIPEGTSRNDIYFTIESGEFSQERKTSAKNVEISVSVVKDSNGEAIPDCISVGTGEKNRQEYKSYVLYHYNNPHWHESFKISIPQDYENYHLVFSSRHCSSSDTKDKEKSGASYGYLKLSNPDGTLIQDKVHTLDFHKKPKGNNDNVFYLKEAKTLTTTGKKGETLKVRSLMVSTKLTQNPAMLSLLRWKSFNGNFTDLMNQFKYVDQSEIVKFLPETFDAMFAILDSKSTGVAIPVYGSLVSTIGSLVDEKKKLSNYRPVLDTYIEKQFSSATAHKHLMSVLKHHFDEVSINSTQVSKLIPTLKTLQYLFKFITVSRSIFNRNQSDKGDAVFKKDLLDFLTTFNQFMSKTSPEVIGAQTLALKNFSSMSQDLKSIFDVKEYCAITIKFIESVQYTENFKLMNIEKLQLIHKLVSSDLFVNKESRDLLVPLVISQVKIHIVSSIPEEVSQCTLLLTAVIDSVQTKTPGQTETIKSLLVLVPILITTIQNLRLSTPSGDTRLDLITVLLSIWYLVPSDAIIAEIEKISSIETKLNFLYSKTKLMRELIVARTYPENWFVLGMFQYTTQKKVIASISTILKQIVKVQNVTSKLKDNSTLEYQLYAEFIQTCILFIKSSALSLETFNDSKQSSIKEGYGDMRLEIIDILSTVWSALDNNIIEFITLFVGPFLELLLIEQSNIKQMAITLYYSLLEREFKLKKTFQTVETLTIESLDKIVNEGFASEQFKETFTKSLETQFKGNDELSNKGKTFLNDMKTLLSLLLGLRRLPEGEAYEDDRTIATLKLMEYLKSTGRKDTYIKYIHMLCDQHLSSNNYTEAAFTILLHAELLAWSDDILEEQGDFPSESSRQRKEKLLRTTIEYLDRAKLWEKAIDLIRELRIQFETITFEYHKLADILQLESSFFRKITATERFFSAYFRVGYYGKGFDASISNREYIYRGFELERISDFNARIMSKFPNATLLTYTEPPPADIINSDGQHLQIYTVRPATQEEMEGKEKKINKKMPAQIQRYQSEININIFVYSRPFRKGKKSGNEFKDLWLCNTYYLTEDAFPTIHRRTEITKKTEINVSPIDNAINTVVDKNKELNHIIAKHESGKENISPFTMVLKGLRICKILVF